MSIVNFTKEADGAKATFNDGQTITWTVGGVRIEAFSDSGFSITGIDGTTTFYLSKNTIQIEGVTVTQDASDIVDALLNDVFDEISGGGSGGGSGAFADITGNPEDNAALEAALDA